MVIKFSNVLRRELGEIEPSTSALQGRTLTTATENPLKPDAHPRSGRPTHWSIEPDFFTVFSNWFAVRLSRVLRYVETDRPTWDGTYVKRNIVGYRTSKHAIIISARLYRSVRSQEMENRD